ncbi:MAG: choice-of-anchor H family protein [Colwelliaceae bacterium]|nr:choice-of-anchor H family protein [Colwelliaceae bacterium]
MFNKLILTAIFTFITVDVMAENNTSKIETTSTGNIKQQWLQQQALVTLKESANEASKARGNNKSGKTRQQIHELNLKDSTIQTSLKAGQPVKTKASNNFHHSFNIYNGYSQLIEDYDDDGFFQTFSVTFDADVFDMHNFDQATVYAELYLSKNGGDWIHYYTTDDFNIYGESEDDEYEVYTTLHQGYVPENYDVLIDLYEVGYHDIVATYSSDDTNELYALPLESSDYDPDYVEYHSESHGHGGSSSAIALLILLSFVVIRKSQNKTRSY